MVSFILSPYNIPPTSKQPFGAIQFPNQFFLPIHSSPSNQMSRFFTTFWSHIDFWCFQTFLTGVPARSFAGATHAIPPGGETVCLQRMRPPVHCQEQLATSRVGAYGHQVRRETVICADYLSDVNVEFLLWHDDMTQSAGYMLIGWHVYLVTGITNVSTAIRSSQGATIWPTIWR